MLTYKMTPTLTQADLPLWEKLALEELGDTIHPGRKQGYFLAREALRLAFREQNLFLEIPRLKLNRHHELIEAPQYTISLSHTPKWGAAVIADKQIYKSVGIDIESLGRTVKDSVIGRISNPNDLSLRNLELWCLKEAAFKAIMNTDKFEKPVEFSDIQISEKSWSHLSSGLKGEWKLEVQNEHQLALAWIKN